MQREWQYETLSGCTKKCAEAKQTNNHKYKRQILHEMQQENHRKHRLGNYKVTACNRVRLAIITRLETSCKHQSCRVAYKIDTIVIAI